MPKPLKERLKTEKSRFETVAEEKHQETREHKPTAKEFYLIKYTSS